MGEQQMGDVNFAQDGSGLSLESKVIFPLQLMFGEKFLKIIINKLKKKYKYGI